MLPITSVRARLIERGLWPRDDEGREEELAGILGRMVSGGVLAGDPYRGYQLPRSEWSSVQIRASGASSVSGMQGRVITDHNGIAYSIVLEPAQGPAVNAVDKAVIKRLSVWDRLKGEPDF
jgi:hypothetical protein